MEITFYGHSCIGIKTGDTSLLLDPFISGNPSAKHINVDLIKADYILITNAHQDHTMDVESIAKRNNAKVISNFEIVEYYYNLGIDGHPMNLGGGFDFPFGYLKFVPALHSSTFPDGKSGGCAGGFVLRSDRVSAVRLLPRAPATSGQAAGCCLTNSRRPCVRPERMAGLVIRAHGETP